MKKLSICIATYNRGRFIGETLNSILSQLEPNVELIIVDGASPDNTQEIMAQYTSRYPEIRYFREIKNSGVDRDYDKAVGYAKGEYCWLMTDDDLLHPGAIRRVLDALNGDVGLLVVNSEVRNADLSVVLEPRRINLEQDREYNHAEAETAFSELANSLSFIGCTVVRRDIWMARDRASYYGTLFVHVGVIFQSPPLERIKVIAQPQIIIRYGNAMWTARGFEIWMFKWPQLIWSFSGVTDHTKSAVYPRDPWRSAKILFQYRATGAYSGTEYRKFLSGTTKGAASVMACAIAVFPATLANFICVLYYALRKNSSQMLFYDLLRSRNTSWASRALAHIFRL